MFGVILKQLRDNKACIAGYNKVVCMLTGKPFDEDRKTYMVCHHDEPISLIDICKNNGVDDALWATRCLDAASHAKDLRLFAVWCARQVEHLMQDERSKHAIDVAERFANGEATEQELAEAENAAYAVFYNSGASAASAAYCAAYDAAADAAVAVALVAYYAAYDAGYGDDMRSKQTEMFIAMCNGEAPWQKK